VSYRGAFGRLTHVSVQLPSKKDAAYKEAERLRRCSQASTSTRTQRVEPASKRSVFVRNPLEGELTEIVAGSPQVFMMPCARAATAALVEAALLDLRTVDRGASDGDKDVPEGKEAGQSKAKKDRSDNTDRSAPQTPSCTGLPIDSARPLPQQTGPTITTNLVCHLRTRTGQLRSPCWKTCTRS
jgi:hypothetical protein